jgi:hypothetical protein
MYVALIDVCTSFSLRRPQNRIQKKNQRVDEVLRILSRNASGEMLRNVAEYENSSIAGSEPILVGLIRFVNN